MPRPPHPEPVSGRPLAAGAARRFVRLLLALAGIAAGLSLAIGLPSGSSLSRSLSVGLYITGCGTLLVGFALAVRGPVRPGHGVTRGLRWISADERDDATADSLLLVALAVVLLVLGVLADTRYPLT